MRHAIPRARPPTPAAVLTIDLGAARRELAALAARARRARLRRGREGRRLWLRPRRAVPALAQAGCRTFFVAHLSEGAARAPSLPEATIYVLNGLLPGVGPAYRASACARCSARGEEIAEWAGFARGRRPAALHVDTGMNRLGLSVPEALALAGDPLIDERRHRPADEPSRQRRTARRCRQRAPDRGFRAGPRGLSRRPGLARQLLRASSSDRARITTSLRPGYALFGGNPTPGRAEPDAAGGAPGGARSRRSATSRPARRVGYNGRWTRPRPRAARHPLARLCRRLSARRRAARRPGPRRRACAARSSA